MTSWAERVQSARASRSAPPSDHELLELQAAVATNPALGQHLASDRQLLLQLTQLARAERPPETGTMSVSQVAASWLCCALGAPPSSHAPRGAFNTTSFSALLASRLGRGSGTRSRRPEDGVRILALDGGGTRALVTIEMLKELERQTGQRIHELFDVIAGTSTGGILAAGIQDGLTLDELERLYLDISMVIFAKEPGWRVQLLRTGGQYRVAKLEGILKRVFPRLTQPERLAAALTHEASAEAATVAAADRAADRATDRAAGPADGPADGPAREGGAFASRAGSGDSRASGGGWSAGWDSDNLTMLERRALQEARYAAELSATRMPPAPPRSRPPPPRDTPPPQPPEPPEPLEPTTPPPTPDASGSAEELGDSEVPPTSLPSRPPHVLIVASLTSTAPPTPYIFRNYEYPPEPAGSASTTLVRHAGTSSVPLWQALRATTAAPSYFAASEIRTVGGGAATQAAPGDPRDAPTAAGSSAAAPSTTSADHAAAAAASALGGDGMGALDADHPPARREDVFPLARSIFQDGGLLANNPSAIALHEARMLFPHAPIACLASFGTGAFPVEQAVRPGSWSSVVTTLVRAATRTEEVHQMLSDLLPILRVPYYRFNPQVGGPIRLPRPCYLLLATYSLPPAASHLLLTYSTYSTYSPTHLLTYLLLCTAASTCRCPPCASTRSRRPSSRSCRTSAAPLCSRARARRTAARSRSSSTRGAAGRPRPRACPPRAACGGGRHSSSSSLAAGCAGDTAGCEAAGASAQISCTIIANGPVHS